MNLAANLANTHLTSSDIAFWDDLAYVGDYGGFRIFDISKPEPTLVKDVRCYGPQADPSVFDTDRDGEADTLVLSVDSVLSGPELRSRAGEQERLGRPGGFRYPDGAWEGLRVRHLGSDRPRADRGGLPGLRLAHQHAAAGAQRPLDVRAELELSARRGPDLRPARARSRDARSTTASFRSSRCRSTTWPPRASSPSCRSSTRVTRTASTSRSPTTRSAPRLGPRQLPGLP